MTSFDAERGFIIIMNASYLLFPPIYFYIPLQFWDFQNKIQNTFAFCANLLI